MGFTTTKYKLDLIELSSSTIKILKNSNWDCLQDPFFKIIEYCSKICWKNQIGICLQDPFLKIIEYCSKICWKNQIGIACGTLVFFFFSPNNRIFQQKLVWLSVTESTIKISTQMAGLICFFLSYLVNWHRNIFIHKLCLTHPKGKMVTLETP
jgi:hypothetical protein